MKHMQVKSDRYEIGLPKAFCTKLGIEPGDILSCKLEDGAIVFKKLNLPKFNKKSSSRHATHNR